MSCSPWGHRVRHDWAAEWAHTYKAVTFVSNVISSCHCFPMVVPYYTSSVRAPIFSTVVLFNFSDSDGCAVVSCVLICMFLTTNNSVHFSGALLYLLATPKIVCKVSIHI